MLWGVCSWWQFPVELAFGHGVQHWSTLTLCNFLIIRRIASCFVEVETTEMITKRTILNINRYLPSPIFRSNLWWFFSEDCSRGGNQTAEARHRQVKISDQYHFQQRTAGSRWGSAYKQGKDLIDEYPMLSWTDWIARPNSVMIPRYWCLYDVFHKLIYLILGCWLSRIS